VVSLRVEDHPGRSDAPGWRGCPLVARLVVWGGRRLGSGAGARIGGPRREAALSRRTHVVRSARCLERVPT
jgi:hypothetical protein